MKQFYGGFDRNSGNYQQASIHQEKFPQITLPLNCMLINQIKNGIIPQTSSNHYEFNYPFDHAVITAKYELIQEQGQAKLIGRLSDNTGSIIVFTSKQKDSDALPEFIQTYQNTIQYQNIFLIALKRRSRQYSIYVRAFLKMKKDGVIQLLNFTIVKDANEITRHNLDIALRYIQRSVGNEQFRDMLQNKNSKQLDQNNPKQNPQNERIEINRQLLPVQQILQYFKIIADRKGDNTQISKKEINDFFLNQFNTQQINEYLSRLARTNEIICYQRDIYILNRD